MNMMYLLRVRMRWVNISSLTSCIIPNDKGNIIGVERICHLDMTLIATKSHLLFIQNGKIIDEKEWRDIDNDGDEPILMSLFDGYRVICIFSSGFISVIDIESREKEELIINVNGNIISAAIDSCSSLITIIFNNHTFSIIDSLFDVIVDSIDIMGIRSGMDELVTVGWGSEKTQFQGKSGKEKKEKEGNGMIREGDSRKCYVEWKNDGEYFIINYYNEKTNERNCTLWNSSGELLSHCLREISIDESCTIRPMGNLIAIASKANIVMAERNGQLRNGILKINEIVNGGICRKISWNANGSIMAVQVDDMIKGNEYLQLWICSNMEWTCKLSIPFSGNIQSWRWDRERWNDISIVSPMNELFQISLSLNYESIEGIVLSMGLKEIRCTNMNRVIIPPPMYEMKIMNIDSPSNISMSNDGISFIDHLFHLYYWKRDDSSRILSYNMVSSIHLSIPSSSIITASSITMNGFIYAYTCSSNHFVIHLDRDGKELKSITTSSSIVSIKWDGDYLIYTDSNGNIWNRLNEEQRCSLNRSPINQYISKNIIYSLTDDGVLYKEGNVISKDVSSFLLSHQYIIWIDNDFLLHIRDCNRNEEVDVRNVEKGSRIVSIASPKIILQMPRGNLETIHSRFFVIELMKDLLNEGKVNNALIEMRKHGIGFELIREFPNLVNNPLEWIESIEDTHLLSLLISQLRHFPELSIQCDSICECILSLDQLHIHRLFPCILTSLLTSSPPDSISVFSHIINNLPLDNSRSSTLRQWLLVCSYFLSSSSIFRSSLSTYNLPFVVEVVEALSMDPNEYMSTLKELYAINDDYYRKYRMDSLREDWNSSLINLSQCIPSRLNEVKDLVINKKLYSLALEVYGNDEVKREEFNEICCLAISFYDSECKWKEASIICRLNGNMEKELMYLEKSNDIDGWIRVWKRNGMNNESLNSFINNLSMKCQWKSLSHLLCSSDCEWNKQIEVHGKAREWNRIVSIVNNEGTNKSESMGRRIVNERANEVMKEIDDNMKEIRRLANRLEIVREKKRIMMEKIEDGDVLIEDLDRIDAFSQTSTLSSRSSSSRSSRASTISRRTKKIEKKKNSLKEGGEWEDAAILITIHKHWNIIRSLFVECSSLIGSLISLRLFSSYCSLFSLLHQINNEFIDLSSSIWPNRLSSHHLTGPISSIYDDTTINTPGNMPKVISIDKEMYPPSPLTDNEMEWNIKLS